MPYEEPNGTVSATVDVRVLEQANSQVAVVGDGTGTLRPQLIGDGELVRPGADHARAELTSRSAPSRSAGWRPSSGPATAAA